MKNSRHKKFLVVCCLVLIGCSANLYKPTIADVEAGKKLYVDLTIDQLNKGCNLYANKCGACHTLYKPKEIAKERWTQVLPDMKTEAKLTDAEYDLICRYLKSKTENPL